MGKGWRYMISGGTQPPLLSILPVIERQRDRLQLAVQRG